MRRYYGACVYAGIIDVIMIALFVWFKWIYEPRQWRARMDKRRARLERDVSMRDLQEMTPRESATVSHDFLAAGDGAATARHLDLARDSKDVLEAGFRDCNKGLRIDLDFEGLGLTLPAPLSRTILRGVRGRIRPGRVTAVMGPSGAGEQGASESSTRRCQCREMSRRHHVTHRSRRQDDLPLGAHGEGAAHVRRAQDQRQPCVGMRPPALPPCCCCCLSGSSSTC